MSELRFNSFKYMQIKYISYSVSRRDFHLLNRTFFFKYLFIMYIIIFLPPNKKVEKHSCTNIIPRRSFNIFSSFRKQNGSCGSINEPGIQKQFFLRYPGKWRPRWILYLDAATVRCGGAVAEWPVLTLRDLLYTEISRKFAAVLIF